MTSSLTISLFLVRVGAESLPRLPVGGGGDLDISVRCGCVELRETQAYLVLVTELETVDNSQELGEVLVRQSGSCD